MEPSYLITWKPPSENKDKGWPVENLLKLVEQVSEKGHADQEWRFNRQKGVQPGQQVYLIRQGPKGPVLLGTGEVVRPADKEKATTLVRFNRLMDPTGTDVLASRAELKAIPNATKHWNAQSSGILLRDDVAEQLVKLAARSGSIPDTAPPPNPDWARDELILALELYFRVPAARGSKAHPACQELSEILNKLPIHAGHPRSATFRNANGVGMKLSNFLRFDPSYKGSGLPSGNIAEKEVWDTFYDNLAGLKAAADAILKGAAVLAEEGAIASDEDEGADEGRVLTRLHKLRERKGSLAKKKKLGVLEKTGALKCEVCSFDFKLAYGCLGEGFAECHHGVPISTLETSTKTTLSDLHIVCANCHRMLHRGKKWPSISELRDRMKAVKA